MPSDPNAGPSSPSPAELAAREVLRICTREATEPHRLSAITARLEALVLSVEERTLREAAKDVAALYKPEEWLVNYTAYGVRSLQMLLRDAVAVLESRLASLKETRER